MKDRPRKLSHPEPSVDDWDCGHFVCEAILRMTGREVITHAKCYQAWDQLRELMADPSALMAYVDEKMEGMGSKLIPVEESRKGDLVIIKASERRRALSIRMGEFCVSTGLKGIDFAPLSDAVAAYKIG